MTSEIQKPSKVSKVWRWLLITVIIIFSIATILVGSAAALAYTHQNKIHQGVKTDNLDLSGLTKTQAENVIIGKFKQTYNDGFNFTVDDTQKEIDNNNNEILQINVDSIIEKAYNYGRNSAWWQNYFQILRAPVFNKTIALDYSLNKSLLKEKLQTEFTQLEDPSKDAEIILDITNEDKKEYALSFSPSTTGGLTFDYNQAIEKLELNVLQFTNPTIELDTKNDKPTITTQDAENLKEDIIKLLKKEDVTFQYGEEKWPIKWSDYARWIKLGLNDDEKPALLLNEEMVNGQLESISQNINIDPVDAKLQIKDGKVTEFQASQNGEKLNIEESFKQIHKDLIENDKNATDLIVEITEPDVSMESTNDLGIKEKIGYGWSDFSGSPANRRHNIGVGSAAMHGIIVAPGEEFTLVGNLGPVDGAHGYLPELVIKENETIPEYGGGLCQVATTMFRAALDAGLKITQRRNHAYRVGYYEPAGTDATIYIPRPDVRFLNDTEHHILVQSKLWGNNLQFEIWGTDDGREVNFEGQETVSSMRYLKPKIFNITAPGPTKEVETTELAPGQRKYTESAHYGADTVFYRMIKYADGTEEKETWSSHYVPWQAVVLVGIDPEQKEKEAQEILEQQAEEENQNTEGETTIPTAEEPGSTESTASTTETSTKEPTTEE